MRLSGPILPGDSPGVDTLHTEEFMSLGLPGNASAFPGVENELTSVLN